MPPAAALTLRPGERLTVRAGRAGAWLYLAVAGRIDVPAMLGSTATHTRSGFGGFRGRALQAGDRLPVADAQAGPGEVCILAAPWLDRDPGEIRVVLAPRTITSRKTRSRPSSNAPGPSPPRATGWPASSTARR